VRVRLRDISGNGIGITHDQAIAVGSEFVIQLTEAAGTKSLLYTVVRCEGAAGVYNIGAALKSVLKPAGPEKVVMGAVAA